MIVNYQELFARFWCPIALDDHGYLLKSKVNIHAYSYLFSGYFSQLMIGCSKRLIFIFHLSIC